MWKYLINLSPVSTFLSIVYSIVYLLFMSDYLFRIINQLVLIEFKFDFIVQAQ